MWLNPAMRRFPEEAKLLGHMLLAYGELELMVSQCLGSSLNNQDTAMRMMFRIIGETARVSAADALMREWYVAKGLEAEYGAAIGAAKKCIGLRNQYAHCHWADHEKAGLFFTNLQDPAKKTEKFEHWWRHIDVPLLTQQAEYFDYAAEGLQFVLYEGSYRERHIKGHAFAKPKAKTPPPEHNPPDQHIPPWLGPADRQRHIERTQAQKAAAR